MRARLEYIYSLHRRAEAGKCLEQLRGFRKEVEQRGFVWMQGQSWLDEITCRTQTRTADILDETQRAYDWIQGTAFHGLRLRALGFLIQRYLKDTGIH